MSAYLLDEDWMISIDRYFPIHPEYLAKNNQMRRFVHLQSRHGAMLPAWSHVPQANATPLIWPR